MSYSYRNWFEEWETKKEAREEVLALERQAKIDLAESTLKSPEIPYKIYICENGQLSFFQPIEKPLRKKQSQHKRISAVVEDCVPQTSRKDINEDLEIEIE